MRRVDLSNWALRISPKFTTGVKYQFQQGFWPDQRSGNPNHPSPPIHYIFKLRGAIDWYLWQPCKFDLGDMLNHHLLSFKIYSSSRMGQLLILHKSVWQFCVICSSLWRRAMASSVPRPNHPWFLLTGLPKAQSLHCQTSKLGTIKDRIHKAIIEVQPETLQRITNNYQSRLQQCAQSDGAHPRDVLFKKWTVCTTIPRPVV